MSENQQPEKTFQIGAVSASVFVNKGKTGRSYRNVVLRRSYRDDEGTWRDANSFSLAHLPSAIRVLEEACDYVLGAEGSAVANDKEQAQL